MDYDESKVDEMVLALLFLTMHEDRYGILVTALLRSVKRLTSFSSAKGGPPAKPFQTSTRRRAGQAAMASLKFASVSNAAPMAPASLGGGFLVGMHCQIVVRVDAVSGHVMFLGAFRFVPAHHDSSLRLGRACKCFPRQVTKKTRGGGGFDTKAPIQARRQPRERQSDQRRLGFALGRRWRGWTAQAVRLFLHSANLSASRGFRRTAIARAAASHWERSVAEMGQQRPSGRAGRS